MPSVEIRSDTNMNTISSRGLALAAKMPVFFDVLKDLWDFESNPNGIVNLGLAENVRAKYVLQHIGSSAELFRA